MGRVNVGGGGMPSAEKNLLVDIVNDATLGSDTIKQNVITALATRGISAVLADAWSSIITKCNKNVNVVTGNIKKGVVIDGVTGNMPSVNSGTANLTTTNGQSTVTVNISTGITYTPSKIFVEVPQINENFGYGYIQGVVSNGEPLLKGRGNSQDAARVDLTYNDTTKIIQIVASAEAGGNTYINQTVILKWWTIE